MSWAEKKKEILIAIKAKEDTRNGLLAASLTADSTAQVRTLNGEIKGLHDQLDAISESEGIKSLGDQIANPLPSGKGAEVLGWGGAGHADVEFDRFGNLKAVEQVGAGTFGEKTWQALKSDNYKRAFMNYVRNGDRYMGATDRKDLEEGLDPVGGFLVPADMVARIIQRKPTPTRVAGMVNTIGTSRDAVDIPKVNYSTDDIYTTGIRATWVGEKPTSTEHAVDTSNLFGVHRIEINQAMLSTAITLSLLEDSAFDLQSWMTGKFGETIDLLSDNSILNGTGVLQPRGILLNPAGNSDEPAVVVTGSAATVTADGLISLDYALPEQYLSGSLAYCMNRTNCAQAVAKLKDSQNRYLFNMGGPSDGGLQGQRPDALLGKPIAYSGFMPNLAANAFPIIFGDWSGYTRVTRLGLSIQVLRETMAKQAMVELVGRMRLGGKVTEPWKFKIQKCST